MEPGFTSSCDRKVFHRETSTNANPILLICTGFLPQFGPIVNPDQRARECRAWEYYPKSLEEIGLSTAALFVSPRHFLSDFGDFGSASSGPTAIREPSLRRKRAEPCDVPASRRGREPSGKPPPCVSLAPLSTSPVAPSACARQLHRRGWRCAPWSGRLQVLLDTCIRYARPWTCRCPWRYRQQGRGRGQASGDIRGHCRSSQTP